MDEDIKAIREYVNILNMVADAKITRVIASDYIDAAGGLGIYKANVPVYEMGLVSILVNSNTHNVLGFYGKIFKTLDNGIIGTRLDLASETIIIDIIDSEGIIDRSINTGKGLNSYCVINEDSVIIGGSNFRVN